MQRNFDHIHNIFKSLNTDMNARVIHKLNQYEFLFTRDPDRDTDFLLTCQKSFAFRGKVIEDESFEWTDSPFGNFQVVSGFSKSLGGDYADYRIFEFKSEHFESKAACYHQLSIRNEDAQEIHAKLNTTFAWGELISVSTDKRSVVKNGIEFRVLESAYRLYFLDGLMVIESVDAVIYNVFERDVRNIMDCFGLLYGSIKRGEGAICQYEESEFNTPVSSRFLTTFRDDYKANASLIRTDIRTFATGMKGDEISQLKREVHPISMESFSTLCTLASEDEQIGYIVGLMLEANTAPLEARSILFAVISESFADYFKKKYPEKREKPIKKSLGKEIIKEFHKIANNKIDSYDDSHPFYKNIAGLNSPTNSTSLLMPFDKLGIPTTDKTRKTVLLRNDYLHGRIPEEISGSYKSKIDKMVAISYHYAFLNNALLLKLCGHKGKILNPVKVFGIPPEGTEGEDAFMDIGQKWVSDL